MSSKVGGGTHGSSSSSTGRSRKSTSQKHKSSSNNNSNSSNNNNSSSKHGKSKSSKHNHNANSNSILSHDLFSYLETLPRKTLLSLYADETRAQYAAKTILQRLPELARQFVIRLSVCGGAFPLSEVKLWSCRKSGRDASEALQRMEALCVIEPLLQQQDEDNDDNNENSETNDSNDTSNAIVRLTAEFDKAIRISLTSLRSTPWPEIEAEKLTQLRRIEQANADSGGSKYPNATPSFQKLETFTQRRWNSVLHFLVGTDGNRYDDPPPAVVLFLEQTGLMQEDPDWKTSSSSSNSKEPPPLVITSKGYEFMLQDVHVQVWQFILQYFTRLDAQEGCQELRREALLFLLCLSYCRVGNGYPASALGKDARLFMRDFSHFGLLYVCKVGGEMLFYPTRVAVNLVVGSLADITSSSSSSSTHTSTERTASEDTSAAALASSASATRALESALAAPTPSDNHIAIIVQTNFQVCAYTTSPLHVSMLGLFCDISNYRRLPNVIFYRITRDSIKSAFKLGIQARQILRFLKMHAHPRLRTGDQPLIPSNVEDQIVLWDRERTRVQLLEVYVIQCQSNVEYHAVKQYALDLGAFGWSTEAKNKIMVHYDRAELVMAFVARWRSRAAQRQAAMDSGGTFH